MDRRTIALGRLKRNRSQSSSSNSAETHPPSSLGSACGSRSGAPTDAPLIPIRGEGLADTTPNSPQYKYKNLQRSAPFIDKLYTILENLKYDGMMRWDTHGKEVILAHPNDFRLHVLPIMFGLGRLDSFYTKMNHAGFTRKINTDPKVTVREGISWSHPVLTRASGPKIPPDFRFPARRREGLVKRPPKKKPKLIDEPPSGRIAQLQCAKCGVECGVTEPPRWIHQTAAAAAVYCATCAASGAQNTMFVRYEPSHNFVAASAGPVPLRWSGDEFHCAHCRATSFYQVKLCRVCGQRFAAAPRPRKTAKKPPLRRLSSPSSSSLSSLTDLDSEDDGNAASDTEARERFRFRPNVDPVSWKKSQGRPLRRRRPSSPCSSLSNLTDSEPESDHEQIVYADGAEERDQEAAPDALSNKAGAGRLLSRSSSHSSLTDCASEVHSEDVATRKHHSHDTPDPEADENRAHRGRLDNASTLECAVDGCGMCFKTHKSLVHHYQTSLFHHHE